MARACLGHRVQAWLPGKQIDPYIMEIQWHLSQITAETGLSDRGLHAHEPRTSKERGRRRLHCAKPSAPQPKLRLMTTKLAEMLEISGNTIADQRFPALSAFAGSAGRFLQPPGSFAFEATQPGYCRRRSCPAGDTPGPTVTGAGT